MRMFLIVALLALGGLGFYFYMEAQKPPQKISLPPGMTEDAYPSGTEKKIPTH